jgi:catechol 2,3-dioxygenase-like lactoylglutathione lyase family enzyme
MLRRIDRLILRVPSIETAVRYYRDVLRLKLIRQEKLVASFAMADGVTELVLRADPDQPADEIYYLVDDVRDLYRRRDALQLKFVQAPQQVGRGFKAAVKDPFGNILLLLDRTSESGGTSTVEDAAAPTALFAGIEPKIPAKREWLVRLYEQIGRTADDLPYTPQFEKLFDQYGQKHSDPKPTRKEVWRHLLNLRKGGKLPRLGEARSESPEVSDEAEEILRKLLGEDIGKRDRLPYTDRFNELVDAFNKTQPRPISPHLVWRLVAKLAK